MMLAWQEHSVDIPKNGKSKYLYKKKCNKCNKFVTPDQIKHGKCNTCRTQKGETK